jgi:DNA-binding response OmpR family regulator
MSTIQPSCPAFVVLDDDPFRKALIASLDQHHFTVTFSADGDEAVRLLRERQYRVILLGVDVTNRRGLKVLEHVREHRDAGCGVLILGEPHPDIRSYSKFANETLLKPVDPDYVATRARTYCGC